jgi:hypothetical protein
MRNTLPRVGVSRCCGGVDLVPEMHDRADPLAAAVALDAGRWGVDGGGSVRPRCRTTGSRWRRRRSRSRQDDGMPRVSMGAAVALHTDDGMMLEVAGVT